MGTSCLIGIRHDDKIYSFRVNYNGYLTGVGQLLLDNFDTEEKVDALLENFRANAGKKKEHFAGTHVGGGGAHA